MTKPQNPKTPKPREEGNYNLQIMTKEETKKGEKNKKEYKGLKVGEMVAFGGLASVCVPYIYYASILNAYGQQHKPKDYLMPGY